MSHPRLLLPCLFLLAACGSSNRNDGPADGANPIDDAAVDTSPDAEVAPACPSPFTVTPDPGAEATATAALQALSPTATLTWAPARGTFASIEDLVIELPACTGATDAFEQMFDVLAQSPTLFQIDRSEWNFGSLPCSEVLATGFHTLVLHRKSFGPFDLQTDVFSVVADKRDGGVILRNFSGVYLPPPPPSLLDLLHRCEPAEDIPGKLRIPTFEYQVFSPPPADYCTPSGVGHYLAAANDDLVIDPAIHLRWTEGASVQIFPEGYATLTVAAANQTDSLLRSNANCADEDGNPRVGWVRAFDAFTGAVLYDHASPDPYCTVCLRD